MTNGIIVVQAGAIEKNGQVHIPSHWHNILNVYAELFAGSVLLCLRDEKLAKMQTLPVPKGLRPVMVFSTQSGLIRKMEQYLSVRRTIRKYVEQANFVFTVIPSNIGTLAAQVGMRCHKPLFFEVAGENKITDLRLNIKLPFRYLFHLYTRHKEVAITQYADLAIYVSRYLAEVSCRGERPHAVVPHTNIKKADISIREDTCTSESIRIISANRVVREKGLQFLVEAIRRLRASGKKITAKLAGDGDYLDDLKRQTHEAGLEDAIEFCGHINAGFDLWKLYREADIMVLPSVAPYEGTPKCIIEAMASSCPVIATDVGGIRAMLEDADSGELIQGGDVKVLMAAINRLISDGNLRRQYIERGLTYARSVTLECRSTRIKELLNKHLPVIMEQTNV